MAAANTNTNKSTFRRGKFPEKTKQLWKAKAYAWGIGYVPRGKYMEAIFPGTEVTVRLDVKNAKKHTPQAGEVWAVTARAYRYQTEKKDKDGRLIVYVEGYLEEMDVRVTRKFDYRKHEVVETTRSGDVEVGEKTAKKFETIISPFTDPNDPEKIVYMEEYFYASDGAVFERRHHSEGTKGDYVKNRAVFLKDFIESVLEKPYKGSVEEAVEFPKELKPLHA